MLAQLIFRLSENQNIFFQNKLWNMKRWVISLCSRNIQYDLWSIVEWNDSHIWSCKPKASWAIVFWTADGFYGSKMTNGSTVPLLPLYFIISQKEYCIISPSIFIISLNFKKKYVICWMKSVILPSQDSSKAKFNQFYLAIFNIRERQKWIRDSCCY